MFKILKAKHYFIIGISLTVAIGVGIGFWQINLFKMPSAEARVDDPFGSTACWLNADCTGTDWCGGSIKFCYSSAGCASCNGNNQGTGICENIGQYGEGVGDCAFYYQGQRMGSCGYCIYNYEAPPPPPPQCDVPNPTYKFSIKKPDGSEMAFISSGGYLAFRGRLFEDLGEGIETYRNSWGWLCSNSDYKEYRITDSDNKTLVAFVYCDQDQVSEMFVRGHVYGSSEYLSWLLEYNNNFLIKDQNGNLVAGVSGADNTFGKGDLVLKGCYTTNYNF